MTFYSQLPPSHCVQNALIYQLLQIEAQSKYKYGEWAFTVAEPELLYQFISGNTSAFNRQQKSNFFTLSFN